MNWKEQPKEPFTYCGKRVTRRKVIATTIFGNFEVYESVGGKVFVRHPFLASNYINKVSGFNNGLEEWFGPSKAQVKNIENGKKQCETVMSKIKSIVATY